MSLQKIIALERANNEYILIDQRRAIASTPSGLKRQMYKQIDRPTEETIRQYNQAHQQQPELMPELDENGDPVLDDEGKVKMKRYLFHPIEAKPVLVDPLEGVDMLTEDEDLYITEGLQIKNDLLVEYDKNDKKLNIILKLLRETESRRGSVADELALEQTITNMEMERDNIMLQLERYKNLLDSIERVKYDIEQKNLHNKGIIESNSKKNKIKLKGYQDQLNVLNKGAFNMTQEPYESDEDYKQRLISHSQIEAPTEALYDAKVYASKEIRNKLKEIIKNDTVIDLIANSLTNEQKYNIMREWGAYAKSYKEIYGDYNPTQSVTDLVAFFTNPLTNASFNALKSRGKISTVTPTIAPIIKPYETTNFIAESANNIVRITRKNEMTGQPTTEHFYIRIVKKPNKAGLNLIVYSNSGDEDSFRELDSKTFKAFLSNQYGYTQNLIDEIKEQLFEMRTFKSDTPNAIKLINKFDIEADVDAKILNPGARDAPLYGWGIKNKEIPKYGQFGNILINTKKLYYDDVLSIRDRNGYQLQGMNPVKVSTAFTKIIIDILENKPVTMEQIEQLKTTERSMYDHLIGLGKLHKEKPHKIDETIERLKNQLEILEGEFNAGNNNPNIKKQMKTLLYKLYHLGAINSNQVKDYLNQV